MAGISDLFAQGRVIFCNTCLLLSSPHHGVLLQPYVFGLPKKPRGNNSFMSHPFLPFMLLGISLCVSHKFLLIMLHPSRSHPSQ